MSFVINTVVQLLLIFFWAIPVGIASTMVSFRELEEKVPFLKNRKNLFYLTLTFSYLFYLFKLTPTNEFLQQSPIRLIFSRKTWPGYDWLHLWFFVNCRYRFVLCFIALRKCLK